ncbi:MAG TPA: hypothetical protein VOB72_10240 [Candidatus Dormibacteraeota bacterium]|nr:hypothetical protein [Candidatus Dormibacteraeota bacterium]
MDRFDERLGEELHREFDAQAVVTPPAHRARYASGRAHRPPRLRAMALVTAAFAIGILAGLVYEGGGVIAPGPSGRIGPIPPAAPSAHSTSAPSAPAARPSSAASARPSAPPRTATASAAPTAVRPGFADDFEADPIGTATPNGWHADEGPWTGVVSRSGHVLRHSSGQDLGHLSAGSPQWADYAVSADVRTDLLDLGFAGVAGRYQDPGDDYECTVGVGGQLELSVVKGGQRTTLDASGVSLDLSGSHNVRLEMRGGTITCALDGTVLLHASDRTFTSGRIALVASAGEAADFDNVRVSG